VINPARGGNHENVVVEWIVGRVLEVTDHPGARGPSYLVRLDLGTRGEREAQMQPGDYRKDDLVGRLLVVTIDDEAIVAAARSHASGPILIQPDRDVEPGTIVT
jgi:tRNA-binding EMAP/Myf-like protein